MSELKSRNPLRRLLNRWGFVPYIIRCPGGRHEWHKTFGDQRMALGSVYFCRWCTRTSDTKGEPT